jgi:phosphoenolpyruvate synthase/pyruvate phosphate dikinase
VAAQAVITARGGMTSHAAVVARGMGKTCVVGAKDIEVDPAAGRLRANGRVVKWGQLLTVDGTTGRVLLGAYYRDDRVLRRIGREPRAPFPEGHELPAGDWSLLEVVKQRAPFWRDDRRA